MEHTQHISSSSLDLLIGRDDEMAESKGTCKVAIGGQMDISCMDQGALLCEDACLDAYELDYALLMVTGHDDFVLRV